MKSIIPTAEAPAAIRRLAGKTEQVVRWVNPDRSVVWWFVIDGKETMCPPSMTGR